MDFSSSNHRVPLNELTKGEGIILSEPKALQSVWTRPESRARRGDHILQTEAYGGEVV